MTKQIFTTELNRSDEDETEVVVKYTINGGCKAQTYGDPDNCYPAEAPEVEIVSVRRSDGGLRNAKGVGDEITLTDAEVEIFTNAIIEDHDYNRDD